MGDSFRAGKPSRYVTCHPPRSPQPGHSSVGRCDEPVMWSETVGLRTRPFWDQTIGLDLGLARCGLGLGLAGLALRCETRSCHARRHDDLEGHSNFSSTIYSFSILCFEHHYCGDRQWRSLTWKLNPPSVFVYFRWFWSWSCYSGLGLGFVSSGLGLGLKNLVLYTSLVY